jgi:anthranilate phosphoribosyltransferase
VIKEAIFKVVEGVDLSFKEAASVMEEIMEGKATPSQIASFITALRMKGETPEEIAGMARKMKEKARTISSGKKGVLDTCGTGGDGVKTFNISTVTAFVVAGAGVPVAKHGNRAVSSQCGSADVLESLGMKIDFPPEKAQVCLNELGITFLFAPLFHPAMKHAITPRREIGIRTVFNILGPLTNPAGAHYHLLGVFSQNLTTTMAKVLARLGVKKAFVVHGADGLDELSTTGENKIAHLEKGKVVEFSLTPEEVGLSRSSLEEFKVETKEEAAEKVKKVLKGEKGAERDIVLLNAAAALIASERASSWKEGLNLARESIDSGRAYEKLEKMISFGRECG